MIYVNFDEQRNLSGFYDSEIHSEIPETAREITTEVHQAFLDNQGKVKINPATLQIEELPPPTEEELAIISQQAINAEALNFLSSTDWKVIRHRDQLAANIPTKLTDEEYQELLKQRQKARDSVVH